MKEFSFSTRVFFGDGALERLRKVENKNVIIVTDKVMSDLGLPDRIADYLTNCKVAVFDQVVPEPPMEVVAAGVDAVRDAGAEAMIAVGGGSVIDAAKAIRVMAKEILKIDSDKWECFAIPTTSGTGSEVTSYAVITDKAKGIKYPLAESRLRPPVAILDPELTKSVPPTITADTGMDVLTHAMEAYVSTGANDFTDAICEKVVELVFKYLPEAVNNGSNLEAREKMHIASCMAGIAFDTAGLGVTHGLAHTLGGKYHIPHGRMNAMILPHVISYNADLDGPRSKEHEETAKKYQKLAKHVDIPASTTYIGVSNLVNHIIRMNKSFGIPATLEAQGIEKNTVMRDMESLVEGAMADVTTKSNPREVKPSDCEKIIKALAGK